MFLRTFRALEFLKAQPEWDGKNLVVYGSSQGGAQALAAAGLDKDVSFLFAGVPAMCDHGGVVCGWPRLVPKDKEGHYDRQILNASKYVDCVNFAQGTTVPALFTVGFVDNTCRPESVYAAYNSYAGPKKIINEPEMGHAIPARHKKAAKREIFKACGLE
jgi:cephalosporin-C deacetylase-like acetyl esterase